MLVKSANAAKGRPATETITVKERIASFTRATQWKIVFTSAGLFGGNRIPLPRLSDVNCLLRAAKLSDYLHRNKTFAVRSP